MRIVSGGQTGADRAALDWAIEHDIPHGGWCPKGRKGEDGVIPARYQLTECPRAEYKARTEWNVRDSDGTVIFTIKKVLTGGSRRTAEFARQHGKPWLHVAKLQGHDYAPRMREFVATHGIKVLNVAGTRASKEPGVYEFVKEVLNKAFTERGPDAS
jgi:hypothetical protein